MSHRNGLIRSFVATVVILTALVGSEARAGFTLYATDINITNTSGTVVTGTTTTVTFGGTTIGLTPITPQTFSAGSGLNLIDVSAQSSSTGTPDTGSFSFSEQFTLVGTGSSSGFVEVATLTGTFNLTQGLMGGIISNMGSPSNTSSSLSVLVNSGSGFSFNSFGYTQPSPNSSVTNPSPANDGNVSLTIIPATAVPEPASLAMFGLGLISVGALARRRLLSK